MSLMSSQHAVILLAAGSGRRMSGRVADKCLEPLAGVPVIAHSYRAFLKSGVVAEVIVTYRDEAQRNALSEVLCGEKKPSGRILYVKGGKERSDSVLAALQALPAETDLVFIHDSARPLIRAKEVQELARLAERDGAASAARPVTDTIKLAEATRSPSRTDDRDPLNLGKRLQLTDLDRRKLWAMETPQVFRLGEILQAYEQLKDRNEHVTDDTAAIAKLGQAVTLLPLPYANPKLTHPQDFAWAEWLLSQRSES